MYDSLGKLACEQAHASRLTCLDGERQPRASEKNGARKSEPAREQLIFEFPVFADERSDPIRWNW